MKKCLICNYILLYKEFSVRKYNFTFSGNKIKIGNNTLLIYLESFIMNFQVLLNTYKKYNNLN